MIFLDFTETVTVLEKTIENGCGIWMAGWLPSSLGLRGLETRS